MCRVLLHQAGGRDSHTRYEPREGGGGGGGGRQEGGGAHQVPTREGTPAPSSGRSSETLVSVIHDVEVNLHKLAESAIVTLSSIVSHTRCRGDRVTI